MKSSTTPEYWQLLRRLPMATQKAARKAYQQFRQNPQHKSLHFETPTN